MVGFDKIWYGIGTVTVPSFLLLDFSQGTIFESHPLRKKKEFRKELLFLYTE